MALPEWMKVILDSIGFPNAVSYLIAVISLLISIFQETKKTNLFYPEYRTSIRRN